MDPIFLSHILDEKTPTYGGKGEIVLKKSRCMEHGDVCNEMQWSFGNHTGTHVDAPRHFIKDGGTIDTVRASQWIFEKTALCVIPKVKPGLVLRAEHIGKLNKNVELILIKTGFERHRRGKVYWQNSPALHPELAVYFKESVPHIRAVGMDFISISNIQNRPLGREAHRAFLGRDIILIEDMKLSMLKSTPRRVLVAPLRVKQGDGAPCSIFAWSK